MTPVRIEERPDVVVHGGPGLGLRRPRTSVDQLCLQGREEALRDGVVPAVADTAHAADDAAGRQLGSVELARVLTATVRVVNEPALRL